MGGCTEELQLETSGTNGAGLDEGELTDFVRIHWDSSRTHME